MNEKQTPTATVRPTKKQREMLSYISTFIAEHGYSPSYREIMTGLDYTSVATVALHVNSLIKRGHLHKRDHSARSLELTNLADTTEVTTNQVAPAEEKWLVGKVDHFFNQAEQASAVPAQTLQTLYVLVGALQVLGLEAAAQSFQPRLHKLKKRPVAEVV
jgi:SOS-response transcriptional repressor LexA